jgi:hypothetical protein
MLRLALTISVTLSPMTISCGTSNAMLLRKPVMDLEKEFDSKGRSRVNIHKGLSILCIERPMLGQSK